MVAMVVSVLLSGRDHRSLDGGPWPGERSARSRQARSEAEDGVRRLFCPARNAAAWRQGKKAGVAVAGRRSRQSRPSGLIRPFEVAWGPRPSNRPMKTTMTIAIVTTRTWQRRSRKDVLPRINGRQRRDWRKEQRTN